MPSPTATPLIKKLGIKPGYRVFFLDEPAHYRALLGPLPEGVVVEEALTLELDFIHYFSLDRDRLSESFPALKHHLNKNGALWISWQKGASKKNASSDDTPLNGNHVREIGLLHGLVDVKVCSVDRVWSALKFMYRKTDRT